MERLLKIGNSIFFVLMLFWTYFTVYFLFQYITIDYTNLKESLAKFLLLIAVTLFFFFHFRKTVGRLCRGLYYQIVNHKLFVGLLLLVIQVVIILTSVGLASSDTTIIYQIATDAKIARTTDYLSLNPNNYLLILWFKFNAYLFGENLVVAMAFWNVFFIDIAITSIYLANKKSLGDSIANVSFVMLILILGLSPQFIYTYSDPIALFLLSLFVLVVATIIKDKVDFKWYILAGVLLAIAYGIRPTVMIFVIAGVIVLVANAFIKKLKPKKNKTLLILFALLSFLLVNRTVDYSLNHQSMVNYQPGKSRSLLYYVDLGLTYSGNLHAELPKKLLNARGAKRNTLAEQDIEKRLNKYNSTTFTGHLFYKYYWMVGEGLFGWYQERVLSENQLLNISWLHNIQQTRFARWVRTYVYVEGDNYFFFALFFQVIWIACSLGLVYFCKFYTEENWYQLWMQITVFGGLLFLFIFEAGRSRYLLQFFPAIISLSAVGVYQLAQSRKMLRNIETK